MVLAQSSSVLLVAVAAISHSVSEAAQLPRSLETYQSSSDFLSAMLARVNQERAAEGLSSLCANNKLQSSAQVHTDDMAAKDYMAHDGSDGSTMSQRITQAGYGWSAVGENVAAGQEDVDAVMDAWMVSPEHKENIMGDYAMLGVAYAFKEDSTYKHYWTQDFGTGDNESCDSGSHKQDQGNYDTEATPVPKTAVHVTTAPETETPCSEKEATEVPVQEATDAPVVQKLVQTFELPVVDEPTQRSAIDTDTPGKVTSAEDCNPQF